MLPEPIFRAVATERQLACAWVFRQASLPGGVDAAVAALVERSLQWSAGSARLDRDRHGQLQLRRSGKGVAARCSLSRSGPLVAVAVHPSAPVGVDLEQVDDSQAWPSVASDCFSTAEREWIAALPAGEQHEAFLRVWTMKEALAKALGLGITAHLQELEAGWQHDGTLKVGRISGSSQLAAGWNLSHSVVTASGRRALLALVCA